jgi:hypothetical protein
VFTPVLAKHTKSFNLVDTLSVGVDRIHRNFECRRAARWARGEWNRTRPVLGKSVEMARSGKCLGSLRLTVLLEGHAERGHRRRVFVVPPSVSDIKCRVWQGVSKRQPSSQHCHRFKRKGSNRRSRKLVNLADFFTLLFLGVRFQQKHVGPTTWTLVTGDNPNVHSNDGNCRTAVRTFNMVGELDSFVVFHNRKSHPNRCRMCSHSTATIDEICSCPTRFRQLSSIARIGD